MIGPFVSISSQLGLKLGGDERTTSVVAMAYLSGGYGPMLNNRLPHKPARARMHCTPRMLNRDCSGLSKTPSRRSDLKSAAARPST